MVGKKAEPKAVLWEQKLVGPMVDQTVVHWVF
jgi:hypothetical protein